MAGDQDFNAMQAQLGLVGQGGSFNPLGIATPAPPPPPMVRHPGDVSRDVVTQTQTQMATTLQTTSAMRLGGMGGLAFGGGGSAVDEFARQYRQNMAGIQSQHLAPYSAQMMGMMGGMGGGFSPGMLPNPAMMTAPGMGIYRPFMPPQAPTVSPFPQMSLLPTPFTPQPTTPLFQTPIELADKMATEAGQRRTAAMFATPGVVARGAADVGIGYMGAGMGAALGARFGPKGAAIGGVLGMAAGVFGSERFGLGETAQHITDSLNPFRTTAIRGQQMLAASQDFVTGGADLNTITGRGLSRRGATHLARRLEDTAYSSDFQKQTGGMFSAQDLTKITQIAGQQGLLNDAQSVDQIHDRVKTISKSLVGFMKIANEPNVIEALKSFAKMRQMGLSVGETLDMAVDARMYAKMAGTTVKGVIESGGLPGAMLFQQQGLSAGLGMRMGVGALGMANAAVAGGAFTPQRLAMLGGVSGVAQHEMESSAAFLKMPMLAAAMSTMGKGGEFGMDGRAVRELRKGAVDINQIATRGVENMLSAVQKQGIGALGMFQVQGTEIQDNLGRLLGPQGTQMAKMSQVLQQMKFMGLQQNPGGFATAGLSMGMTPDQVKSMMSQANSPEYFDNLRKQLDIQKMELRALGNEEFERTRGGIGRRIRRAAGGFRDLADTYQGFRDFGEDVVDFFSEDAELSQIRDRGQIQLTTNKRLIGTSQEVRAMREMSEQDIAQAEQSLERYARPTALTSIRRGARDTLEMIQGGNVEDRMQVHTAAGGMEGLLFGNNWFGRTIGAAAESQYRLGAALLTGTSGGLSTQAETEAELTNRKRANDVWGRGQSEGVEERKDRISSIAKETGKSEKDVRSLLSEVEVSLGERAKEFKRLGGMGASTTFDVETAKDLIREKAKARGIRLSDAQVESMAVAATPMAEVVAGDVDVFRSREMVGVRADKQYKEALQTQQDSLSADLFGSHGTIVTESTKNRRAQLMSKIFGNQPNGRVGMLAALVAAGGPEAKAALDAATEEEKATVTRMLSDMSEEDKADIRGMGEKLKKTKLSAEDILASGEGIRNQELAVKRKQVRAEGRLIQFGEGVSLTKTTEELLRSESREGMSAPMRKLAEEYEVARIAGEDTSGIIRKAERLQAKSGVAQEKRAAGGPTDKSERALKEQRAVIDETQEALSSAFPEAVDTFNEASHRMIRAAELLYGRKNTLLDPGSAQSAVDAI